MKKFELTANTKIKYGRILTQIKAAISFGFVKQGDLGGWIENEASLGDDVWIYQDAEVFRAAVIRGGVIRGGVIRGGEIWGGEIWGGEIRGGEIRGGVIRGGEIWGGEIRGGVIRGGEIWGGVIRGGVIRGGVIRGGVIRGGEIWGGEIWGGEIRGGVIKKTSDYIAFCSIGSAGGVLTAYISNKEIEVTRGCFRGTLAEFEAKVTKKHAKNEFEKEYKIAIQLIHLRFDAEIKLLKKPTKKEKE